MKVPKHQIENKHISKKRLKKILNTNLKKNHSPPQYFLNIVRRTQKKSMSATKCSVEGCDRSAIFICDICHIMRYCETEDKFDENHLEHWKRHRQGHVEIQCVGPRTKRASGEKKRKSPNTLIFEKKVRDNKFCEASRKGNIELMKKMMEEGDVDVEGVDSYHNTPLHCAIQGNSLESIKFLLTHGANPNNTSDGYTTPLIFAVKKKDMPIIEELLNHGADPKISTLETKETVLHVAVEHMSLMEYLISKARSVINVENSSGFTVLDLALGKFSTEYEQLYQGLSSDDSEFKKADRIVDLLLKNGATGNEQDVIEKYKKFKTEKVTEADARRVIETESDGKILALVTKHPEFMRIALVTAIRKNKTRIAKILFDRFPDPNIVDENGIPIILIAAINKNAELLEHMFTEETRLDVTDPTTGNTIIHILHDDYVLLKLVISNMHGTETYATVDVRNLEGMSPLDLAYNLGLDEFWNVPQSRLGIETARNIVELLYKAGARDTDLNLEKLYRVRLERYEMRERAEKYGLKSEELEEND